jgi:hypothetical protein
MLFIPNQAEDKMITEIVKRAKTEYTLIRLTGTMLKKSIIDASETFRVMLKDTNIVDYYQLRPGIDKLMLTGTMLTTSEKDCLVSIYRPLTKKGDPRFCIYGLKSMLQEDDMVLVTIFNGRLVVIPLVKDLFSTSVLDGYFKYDDSVKEELVAKLHAIIDAGAIESVSPYQSNPKDVGDTLEKALGILPNSDKHADYLGKIEIKSKRTGTKTKDTLFSMIPNWSNSNIGSSPEMILTYGYESRKYEDFMDLFVTVNDKPNNQGLFLEVDESRGVLVQKHQSVDGTIIETCVWNLEDLKKRLYEKHPATIWVEAKEIKIDGKIHFKYQSFEYTSNPIFSSFLLLIAKGAVTYDWRGRVRIDRSGYKDKGHCFRVSPKNRDFIFGETEKLL